ncbi:MAG: UbiA family prenyltransferase [Parcubacteria group bacterium]|jgi:homogentisate phytyltransferase/homogentisate geranylgeranyltransferase
MFDKTRKIVEKIENYPLDFRVWLSGFSAIMIARLFLENFLSDFKDKPLEFFAGSALVTFLFFLFAYLLILILLKLALREKIQKLANVLLWGFWLAAFPPLIDRVWCGKFQACWSFYTFDGLSGLLRRFLTFFGDNPRLGITYGVRTEVALAVLFVAIYAYLKTKKPLRSLGVGFLAYVILFVLGSFPSWLTFLVYLPSKGIGALEGHDVAGLFLSGAKYFSFENGDFMNSLNIKMSLVYAFLAVPALIFFFWQNFQKKFRAVAKNIRWIQIMVHAGVIIFGFVLGVFYFPRNFPNLRSPDFSGVFFPFLAFSNLILAAVFAWIASIFPNDVVDFEIDKETNKKRPLVTGEISKEEYWQLFLVFFVMSLVLAASVGVKFFLIVLFYQVIGWVYSCPPFRLKRFPILATFISAQAFILLFMCGFILISDNQDISQFPMKIFWLLTVSFTISLPIKDIKDIEGDKKNGIWTIPVLLGETGSRFAIGLGIFISYALSVILLNAKILFLPAMILGAISFWVLQNKKISPRRVHIWVFGFLFLYVVLMAYFLFLPSIMV